MGHEIIYYNLLADKKFINDDNFIVIANALAIRKIGLQNSDTRRIDAVSKPSAES